LEPRLGVEARLVGLVYAEPEHLALGRIRPGAALEASLAVTGVNVEAVSVQIGGVEGANEQMQVEAMVEPDGTGSRIVVALHCGETSPNGPFRREALIEIAGQATSIRVPIFGVVER